MAGGCFNALIRNKGRSYWIPGAYAPALSEKRNSFLRLLKNKGFKEERMTKVGLYAIGTSTTLESNKSHLSLSLLSLPNPTATLECIAKICPCKMAVLQGPVTRGMSV